MVRTKDGDGIKSNLIISEVRKRPCLFDTNDRNYGDRSEKSRCWQEVYESVVPSWMSLGQPEKLAAGKEVQKRWRSIRDSYTKSFRQGKCVLPEECPVGSRRHQYHSQMSFLLKALQNKKSRYPQDKYESFSEVSNSSQHGIDDVIPMIKTELDKPLDLEHKAIVPEKPVTLDKCSQATIENDNSKNPSFEINLESASIFPEDHLDDDKLFLNSLIPFFKKMNDDTRLKCRIDLLKVIRASLNNNDRGSRQSDDSVLRDSGISSRNQSDSTSSPQKHQSKLSMTTRSADGSRLLKKRKIQSPSPVPVPLKKRGPGRPRKIRPPSDSDDEQLSRKKSPNLKASIPVEIPPEEDNYCQATSIRQLSTTMLMKYLHLERSKDAPILCPLPVEVSVGSEPANLLN